MKKRELQKRLRQLREDLDSAETEEALNEIETEIEQIEAALDELSEVVDEAQDNEEAADEAEEREGDEEDEENPEEEEAEAEERRSLAARRAELRRRVREGNTAVIRTFKEERTMNKWTRETKEYRRAWLSSLQGKPVSAQERAALAGGNYAIPQETLNKVYGAMELYPLLNAVDVMHIPGTVEIPVEGTVNEAAVVAMGNAATDAADTLTHVSLGAYKLIKTIEITADVMAMSIPAFETWLVDRLANKLYRLATALVATGSGTNTITGLTSVSATGHTYTKTGLTYKDLMAIIAALPSEWLPNAKFVMSRQVFFTQVLGLTDTQGNPVVVADRQAPAIYNILGFQVILEDTLNTTGSIVFGDLKEGYVLNFGKDVEVARDDSVGFRTGSSVFRGMALADGKPTGVGLVRYIPAT